MSNPAGAAHYMAKRTACKNGHAYRPGSYFVRSSRRFAKRIQAYVVYRTRMCLACDAYHHRRWRGKRTKKGNP